jgi:hypothetical protein
MRFPAWYVACILERQLTVKRAETLLDQDL